MWLAGRREDVAVDEEASCTMYQREDAPECDGRALLASADNLVLVREQRDVQIFALVRC